MKRSLATPRGRLDVSASLKSSRSAALSFDTTARSSAAVLHARMALMRSLREARGGRERNKGIFSDSSMHTAGRALHRKDGVVPEAGHGTKIVNSPPPSRGRQENDSETKTWPK